MNKLTFIFFLLVLFGNTLTCKGQYTLSVTTVYSQYVKDSFDIYIDLPQNYTVKNNQYSIAFYMDATRTSGKDIRQRLLEDAQRKNLHNVLFIGVGHIGKYKKLRPRDFIPPKIKRTKIVQSKNPYFGHADVFYQFLTLELIPYINQHYPNKGKYTYIGHSYGGLFGFYCLLRDDPVFLNFILLSPALWVNCNNIFKAEEEFYSHQQRLPVNVYHACGTGEWGNLILSTSRRMRNLLKKRKYTGLNYHYEEIKGKTHLGMLQPALESFFKEVVF